MQAKLKCAIYTRVSTKDQTTLNQRIRLEKYAEMQGWEVEIFEEIDHDTSRVGDSRTPLKIKHYVSKLKAAVRPDPLKQHYCKSLEKENIQVS